MPISHIQKTVLKTLAANRNPKNYLAGATVLHQDPGSPRLSQDIDFFHDLEEQIAQSAEQDASTLAQAGYSVTWLLRTPFFHRAIVKMDENSLRLEWAQDSAFRFFPIVEDQSCGYRLHETDAATNKLLALGGRSEIRDFVDTLYIHANSLSLGALAWAACGKDPGFTPVFLLEQANRHTAYTQSDLNHLQLSAPLDLHSLKQEWIAARESAQQLIEQLPPEEVGCLYLDEEGNAVTPDPASNEFSGHTRHYGSICGAWPTVIQG